MLSEKNLAGQNGFHNFFPANTENEISIYFNVDIWAVKILNLYAGYD